MIRVTFIINGLLKSTLRVQQCILDIKPEGMEVSVLLTKSSMEAIDLAEEAIKGGSNFIISVGGDGMVNEVVNGYMRSPEQLRNNVALGVYSAGKGNDYIKSLGTNGELEELFNLIKGFKTRTVDVGLVTCVGVDGNESQRYFNNITDVGLGGYIIKNVDLSGVFINGFFTYQKATIQTFLTYKHIRVRLESEELTWEGPILSLVLAKGSYFGSGICIAPHANLDDGKLGLVLIGEVGLWEYLKNLGKVKKGIKLDHPEASYHTIGDCTITPLEGDCPIDMDGEYIGSAPMGIKIIPGAVQFLCN